MGKNIDFQSLVENIEQQLVDICIDEDISIRCYRRKSLNKFDGSAKIVYTEILPYIITQSILRYMKKDEKYSQKFNILLKRKNASFVKQTDNKACRKLFNQNYKKLNQVENDWIVLNSNSPEHKPAFHPIKIKNRRHNIVIKLSGPTGEHYRFGITYEMINKNDAKIPNHIFTIINMANKRESD